MTFRIDIDTTAINQALSGLSKAVDDMTPIMRQLGGDIAAITEQNFDSEGARIGKKWKPSQRAMRQGVFTPANSATGRRASYKFGQTLRKDGHLAASISVGGADHVQEVGPNYVLVGTSIKYAAMHQFGGTKAKFPHLWGDIPARPFFGLNAQDEQDIAETIAKALDAALK